MVYQEGRSTREAGTFHHDAVKFECIPRKRQLAAVSKDKNPF